jgi:hypothetical protein
MEINPLEFDIRDIEKLDAPEFRKAFIDKASCEAGNTAMGTAIRVAAELYFATILKSTGDDLENAISKMTESLERAFADHAEALDRSAKASDKHASSLKWATWALAFATSGLVFIAIIQLFVIIMQ